MRNILWTTSVLLGALSSSAAGQLQGAALDTSLHVLEVPAAAQPLLCNEVNESDTLRARGASMWEFEVGAPLSLPAAVSVRPRQIVAAFDSAGTPLLLSDMVTLMPIRSDQVVLRFISGSGAVGRWTWIRLDSAALARMDEAMRSGGAKALRDAIPPAQVRDVTAEEQSRARTLANWLWKRRCRR